MIDVILVLFTLFFITSLGFVVIKYFDLWHKEDNLLVLACSYGLGVGIIAMQLYLYSRIGLLWNLQIIIVPWLFFLVYVFVKSRQKFKLNFPKPPTFKKINFVLLTLIFLAISYVFFEALIRPVSVWDGVSIWLYKSKVFFIDQAISQNLSVFLSDPGYPLIVSLLGSFIYIILGHVNDSAVLLTSFAFYFFNALLLFTVIKKRFGLTYALVFTFLFVTTQNFIRHGGRMEAGQADLPLGYYSLICFILLIEYIKKNKTKILLLLSIFLGITGLIKSEAVFITIAIAIPILYQVYKTKLYNHLLVLSVWILPVLDWEWYKKIMFNLNNSHSLYQQFFSAQRIANTFSGMIKEFINIKSWNILWIAYFYSFFAFKIKNNKELILLNFIILSQFLIYFLIYIFFTGYTPDSSAERLYVHIAPLVFYYLAILTSSLLKNSKHN